MANTGQWLTQHQDSVLLRGPPSQRQPPLCSGGQWHTLTKEAEQNAAGVSRSTLLSWERHVESMPLSTTFPLLPGTARSVILQFALWGQRAITLRMVSYKGTRSLHLRWHHWAGKPISTSRLRLRKSKSQFKSLSDFLQYDAFLTNTISISQTLGI